MDDRGLPDRVPERPRGRSPGRSPLRLVLAAAVAFAGLVWIGQGLGILTAGGSFMIGDPKWAAIGAVFVVLGALLAWRSRPS